MSWYDLEAQYPRPPNPLRPSGRGYVSYAARAALYAPHAAYGAYKFYNRPKYGPAVPKGRVRSIGGSAGGFGPRYSIINRGKASKDFKTPTKRKSSRSMTPRTSRPPPSHKVNSMSYGNANRTSVINKKRRRKRGRKGRRRSKISKKLVKFVKNQVNKPDWTMAKVYRTHGASFYETPHNKVTLFPHQLGFTRVDLQACIEGDGAAPYSYLSYRAGYDGTTSAGPAAGVDMYDSTLANLTNKKLKYRWETNMKVKNAGNGSCTLDVYVSKYKHRTARDFSVIAANLYQSKVDASAALLEDDIWYSPENLMKGSQSDVTIFQHKRIHLSSGEESSLKMFAPWYIYNPEHLKETDPDQKSFQPGMYFLSYRISGEFSHDTSDNPGLTNAGVVIGYNTFQYVSYLEGDQPNKQYHIRDNYTAAASIVAVEPEGSSVATSNA